MPNCPFFLEKSPQELEDFLHSILNLRSNITECPICHALIEKNKPCFYCKNPKRDPKILCVVERISDLLAIEATKKYQGLYHVLGGAISPLEGIYPEDLHLEDLFQRVKNLPSLEEILLATNPTIEGENTAYYIYKKLKGYPIKFTRLASGLPKGVHVEFADPISLSEALLHRIPFSS